MNSPVCAGDDPMQLTGSPCCSGAVTLAFQVRLLHTGATITSTINETPATLNLLHGLLLGHEKPDNSLHPLLLTSFTHEVFISLRLPPSLPHNGQASKPREDPVKIVPSTFAWARQATGRHLALHNRQARHIMACTGCWQ